MSKELRSTVTGKKAKVGDLVIKGPDWVKYHGTRYDADKDGKVPGVIHSITMTKKGYVCEVKWSNTYNIVHHPIGREGVYTLSFFEIPIDQIIETLDNLEKQLQNK